jgi:hypothetical protein
MVEQRYESSKHPEEDDDLRRYSHMFRKLLTTIQEKNDMKGFMAENSGGAKNNDATCNDDTRSTTSTASTSSSCVTPTSATNCCSLGPFSSTTDDSSTGAQKEQEQDGHPSLTQLKAHRAKLQKKLQLHLVLLHNDDDDDYLLGGIDIPNVAKDDEIMNVIRLCAKKPRDDCRGDGRSASSSINIAMDDQKDDNMDRPSSGPSTPGPSIPPTSRRPPRSPPMSPPARRPVTAANTSTTMCSPRIKFLDDELQLYKRELLRYQWQLQEKLHVLQKESQLIDQDMHRIVQ